MESLMSVVADLNEAFKNTKFLQDQGCFNQEQTFPLPGTT